MPSVGRKEMWKEEWSSNLLFFVLVNQWHIYEMGSGVLEGRRRKGQKDLTDGQIIWVIGE